MAEDENKHFTQDDYDKEHNESKKTRGCLSKCKNSFIYDESNRCSYRRQSVEKARELKEIYNIKSRPEWHVDKKSRFIDVVKSTFDRYASAASTAFEVKGDVFKKKSRNEMKDHVTASAINFYTGFVPYSNNAHHVVPDAEVRKAIASVTKDADLSELDMVMRVLLMRKKYNVHEKDNMLILPREPMRGCDLGLPIHINNHTSYSSSVVARLKEEVEANFKPIEGPHPKLKNIQNMKEDFYGLSRTFSHDITKPGSRSKIKTICRNNIRKNKESLLDLNNLFQGV